MTRNATIELHDSTVSGLRALGAELVIELDAYVHVSEGEPGVDPGEGWIKPVRVVVREGVVEERFEGARLSISDGEIQVKERVFENLVPAVVDAVGVVAVRFTGCEGRLRVRGTGLRVEVAGEGRCVERLG